MALMEQIQRESIGPGNKQGNVSSSLQPGCTVFDSVETRSQINDHYLQERTRRDIPRHGERNQNNLTS